MKITAIIGSQRKGNTLATVRAVESVMKEQVKDLEFEFVMLMDADVRMCVGCFNCLAKGIEFCPLKDEVPSIIEKIRRSDGVIFATPVYVLNVTPFMKNFIDRLSSICHRPEFFKKHAMIVSTVGGYGIKETLKYMRSIVKVWGFRSVAELGIETPPVKKIPDKLREKNDIAIRRSTEKFLKNLENNGVLKPELVSVIQFEVQKAVFSKSRDDLPADYDFYQRLADKNYYVDAKVSFCKTLIGRIMSRIVLKTM